MVQLRLDGSESFYRDWATYKNGFGNLTRNFWLGNDNIHLLTKHHDQKLKIELTHNDEVKYVDYSTFWIENEAQKYKLTVSGFSGSSPPGQAVLFVMERNLIKYTCIRTDDHSFKVKPIFPQNLLISTLWYPNSPADPT